MASKKDKTTLAAEKARKQRIIAIVGGVVLLGLALIQGPKLWKQLNPPTPKAAAAAAVTAPATTGSTTQVVAASTASSTSTAVLAGVPISAGTRKVKNEDGKLLSFSLFKPKDPFVPQVSVGGSAPAPSGSTSSPAPTSAQATVAASSGAASTATGSSMATVPTKPAKLAFATIEVNGRAQKVALKRPFPKPDPIFVVVELSDAGATIGVNGGSFKNGKTVSLKMGEQITLVDSATGTRYALKLVYVGAAPEKTEAFSTTTSPAPKQTTTP